MPLKARNDIHLARRIWHFGGVLSMGLLYAVLTQKQAFITALSVSAFLIGLDVSRLYVPRLNTFLTWLFSPFLRESERHRIAGSTYMLVGVTLAIYVFPKPPVLLSLLFFSVADPLASYCGIRFGRDKLVGNKTLQGSLAAFVACFIVAIGYLVTTELMTERMFIVALIAAWIGALSELVPVGKLDDNLVFPVLSSALLTLLFYVFGGL